MCNFKRVLRTWPPIIVIVLLAWSYYTYNFEFCVPKVSNRFKRVAYMVIYHILILLVLFMMVRMITCKVGCIPSEYRLTVGENARLLQYDEAKRQIILREIVQKRRLEVYTRGDHGEIRYCKICRLIKPDRTHHCSACNMCVLRMDHHCIWMNHCVGYRNHKFFVLLILYSTIFCFFMVGTMAEYGPEFWGNREAVIAHVNITSLFVVSIVVGLLVFALTIYQIVLISKNETTIESLGEMVFENEMITFDLGKRYNMVEIFGDNYFLWLVPTWSSKGNGCIFNIKNLD